MYTSVSATLRDTSTDIETASNVDGLLDGQWFNTCSSQRGMDANEEDFLKMIVKKISLCER